MKNLPIRLVLMNPAVLIIQTLIRNRGTHLNKTLLVPILTPLLITIQRKGIHLITIHLKASPLGNLNHLRTPSQIRINGMHLRKRMLTRAEAII